MLSLTCLTTLLLAVFGDAHRVASTMNKRGSGRVAGRGNYTGAPLAGIIVTTRFNCAFPFCPTTALDVCALDEHYEIGRPIVLATLIEQTPTAEMGFFAYSTWDNSTRMHYTLAARLIGEEAKNQLFSLQIALNGTAGTLLDVGGVFVDFPPPLTQADIRYIFTRHGNVYISFAQAMLLTVSPLTGAVLNVTSLLPSSDATPVDSLASAFDDQTGTFFVNAVGADGLYLHSYSVDTHSSTLVGPLPAAPGTAGADGKRVDTAVASMAVYPPNSTHMTLLEMRTSTANPFLFMAFLDPVTGVSEQIPLDEDWYQDWDIDPNFFPDQWKGSLRRVWDFDRVNLVAFFKLYDECGYVDDCDENDSIVYLQWAPGSEPYWYVAVEPVEPELTQLVWVWTDVVH